MTMEKNGRMMAIALAWLTAAGLFVRAWGLGRYFLSPDEVLILTIAGARDLGAVFRGTLTQAHPPGHFFLMHYLLQISRNIYFLKASSLLPGAMLPAAGYFLGRRVSGRAAGLVMAAAAALGYGPVLMSEVIRPYAALTLFLVLALWSYAAYAEGGRRVHAFGYTLAMAAALALHYSAALAAAAVGGTWFLKLVVRRRPAREYAAWTLAHLPLTVMAAAFYYFHLSRLTLSHKWWMQSYLSPGVAHGLPELARNAYTVFFFLFHPGIAPLAVALTLFGFYALARTGRGEWAALSALAFLITLVLSLLDVYPLYGSRHDMFLFPFAAILAGASVQYLCAAGAGWLERGGDGKRPEALRAASVARPRAGLLLLVLATLLVGIGYGRSDFLRGKREAVNTEFTLTRAAYEQAFDYLRGHAGPDDRVLCPGQAGDYLRFSAWPEAAEPVTASLARIRYRGVTFFCDTKLENFSTGREVLDRLDELEAAAPVKEDATVWFFNIGYGNGVLGQALAGLFSKGRAPVKVVEQGPVIIYGVPGRAVVEAMKE